MLPRVAKIIYKIMTLISGMLKPKEELGLIKLNKFNDICVCVYIK